MKTLEDQLLSYGGYLEQEHPRLSASEVTTRETVAWNPRRQPRPGWLFAVTAGIVVLMTFGLVAWWLGVDNMGDPADSLPVGEPIEIQWTEVTGSSGSLPSGSIDFDPGGGGYVSYSDGYLWRSENGLVWARETGATGIDGYDHIELFGDWARASRADTTLDGETVLFESVGSSWVPLALPAPSFPDIKGLTWSAKPLERVVSEETTLITGVIRGWVPWADIYGTSSYECQLSEPCISGPWAQWDPLSRVFELRFPSNEGDQGFGPAVATLEAAIAGSEIRFIDTTSGQLVHTITTDDAGRAHLILDQLEWGDPAGFSTGWVRSGPGRAFELVSSPWPPDSEVFSTPVGGFAAYSLNTNPEAPHQPGVWTSQDGVGWVDHGAPGLNEGTSAVTAIYRAGGRLVAEVTEQGSLNAALYFSSDGLRWEHRSSTFGTYFLKEANFGLVAIPMGDPWFAVSRDDGVTWQEIDLPTGIAKEMTAGFPPLTSAGGGAAGDFLFFHVTHEDDRRSLWVGRPQG